MSNNPLLQLQSEGVSVWLDYLSRDLMGGGGLQKLIDNDGLRGETSNPSIFQAAISKGDAYNAQINDLAQKGMSAESICWELMIADVQRACDMFRPLYDSTEGRHGFVSLECSPLLADKTEEELAQARDLWKRVHRPNLMVKVPGTKAGLPVIEEALADGININVTLLFSAKRYEEVIEVFMRALERRVREGKPVDRIASVASFFVSRVDTEVEKRLGKISGLGAEQSEKLHGTVAVANALVAYELFERQFASDRWKALEAKGARLQNPLWASTSTKNPKYSDTLYVAELIGPHCVNTMPEETVDAFRDHGQVKRTLTSEAAKQAHQTLALLAEVGVDIDDVTLNTLEREGVQKFNDAYNQLLSAVSKEREIELSRA
jgi:transaldolase